MTRSRHPGGERGLLSTELALLMPAMMLLALVAVFGLQVARHESRAQAAADAAARAASQQLSETDAALAARAAAENVCRGTVDMQAPDWVAASEATLTPGRVTVTLSCTEPFTGFGPLFDNTTRTAEATAVATIEYWRPAP